MTGNPLAGDIGIGSWPARRARITPDKPAFEQGDRVVTYQQCAERVDALAAGFAHVGVQPGDRIAYLGANDIATFEVLFAAGRINAIFVPLSIRSTPTELAYLLGDSRPRFLVHDPAFRSLIEQATDGLAVTPELLETSRAPDGRHRSLDDVLSHDKAEGLPADGRPTSLDDTALLLYTSGTTGKPKGAMLTHGNLTFNTFNQLAHVDVTSTDIACCTAPLFHVTGLGQVTLPTLFKGGTVVIAPKFDAGWLLETIASRRITAFSAVPTMLKMMCEHPSWPAADVTSLRYVIYGGSPVEHRVAQAWLDRDVPLLQGYGMTEAAPGVSMAVPGAAATRPTSVGVAHFYTDIAHLDDHGQISSSAGTGELLVKGPNVFRGYWQRPDETDHAFTSGWYRTGDIVHVADDGWGQVVDRVKDMIISGGENIYPAEIEAVLLQLPSIAEAAVIGVPDERWGEVGQAFLVPRPGTAVDEPSVRRHLEAHLARFKLPKTYLTVDSLPRTPSGKVRKAALRGSSTIHDPTLTVASPNPVNGDGSTP